MRAFQASAATTATGMPRIDGSSLHAGIVAVPVQAAPQRAHHALGERDAATSGRSKTSAHTLQVNVAAESRPSTSDGSAIRSVRAMK